MLVAAGTVFGDIIVWRCSVSPTDSVATKVLHTFTGHEGSIFGVEISQRLTLLSGDSIRLLASCSDDRTIRLWLISENARHSELADINLAGAIRETGFGGQSASTIKTTENRCLTSRVCHASRIWSVRFHITSSQIVHVLSFGEDATAQQWLLLPEISKLMEPDSKPQHALAHQRTWACHGGKHIWATAMKSVHDSKVEFVTGGADYKICHFVANMGQGDNNSKLSSSDRASFKGLEPSDGSRSWSMQDIQQQLAHQDTENGLLAISKDSINRYNFISEDSLLMTTTAGRVLLGKLSIDDMTFAQVQIPASIQKDLVSYSIVKASLKSQAVFIGSASGNVYVYRRGTDVQELVNVGAKVADIFVQDLEESTCLLVTNMQTQEMTLFRCITNDSIITIGSRTNFGLPDGFVATSAAIIDQILLVGSRHGHIAIHDLTTGILLMSTPLVACSGDAITSIIAIPGHDNTFSNDQFRFLVTSRNGSFSIYSCRQCSSDTTNDISLKMTHHARPPIGPMLESAWFDNGELYLSGFKSTKFMIWNETKGIEVLAVTCGGAHRSHAYIPVSAAAGAGRFVYTKASRLYFFNQAEASHRVIKAGGHGREIKSCAVAETKGLIATGAEDTNIKIWTYSDKPERQCDFQCLTTIQKHTTGIQHLQWLGSDYLFSSAGNEEFFIWSITRISGFGVGVVCEAERPMASDDRDLRIMAFDVSAHPAREPEGEDVDKSPESEIVITLGYSDSTLRSFTYSRSKGYQAIASAQYTTACLTQVRHLEYRDDNTLRILTTATDGVMAIWQCSTLPLDQPNHTLLQAHRIHQSSIKSLAHQDLSPLPYHLVATGGDDNALAVTVFHNQFSSSQSCTSTVLAAAHAAAITGISFQALPHSSEGLSTSAAHAVTGPSPTQTIKMQLLSSSNDQRVKLWNIIIKVDISSSTSPEDQSPPTSIRIAIHETANLPTSIADVSAVEMLSPSHPSCSAAALVLGNGMEVFRLA